MRANRLGEYFQRELQRMPPMDISDVAYDRFLANGRPQLSLPAAPHETVRLRLVDGSATTYFHLEFAGGPMAIVAADGQDVAPAEVKRFLIGVAETYDVLVRMPAEGAYELRALKTTAFNADQPVRSIRLTLDGDMQRYVWFINIKPISESDVISIRAGEVARFIMINRTMMHHPMHLHGHFFRVINGQGDHAPLKHTVDVAPMSTTVIEFNANEIGDWLFHCHLLYHMKNGMTRVLHYRDFNADPRLAALRPDMYKDPWVIYGQTDALTHMTEGFLTAAYMRNILTAEWEIGWQGLGDTDWEGIVTWDRYFNRFFSAFIGADWMDEGEEDAETRAVLGIRYLLPLNIASRSWLDSDGGARVGLEKEWELTPRLALHSETQYDTNDTWEGSAGLSYMVHKHFSILGQWHFEFGWGAGVQI